MDGSCRRIGRNLGDRVLPGRKEFARSAARVSREMPGLHGGREACRTVALGMRFQRGCRPTDRPGWSPCVSVLTAWPPGRAGTRGTSTWAVMPLTAAIAALPEWWPLCQPGQETDELTPLRRGEGSKHGLLDLFENGVEPEQRVGALGSERDDVATLVAGVDLPVDEAA
jgi:hypothetical protein